MSSLSRQNQPSNNAGGVACRAKPLCHCIDSIPRPLEVLALVNVDSEPLGSCKREIGSPKMVIFPLGSVGGKPTEDTRLQKFVITTTNYSSRRRRVNTV